MAKSLFCLATDKDVFILAGQYHNKTTHLVKLSHFNWSIFVTNDKMMIL